MSGRGLKTDAAFQETSNFRVTSDKPLKFEENQIKKVDINVLKARAQTIEKRENRKNISIMALLLIIVAIVGIYLSI